MAQKKWLSLTNALIGLAVIFLVIQFFRIDKTNSPIVETQTLAATLHPPQDVALVLQKACYDCHSNEVSYPWYSDVAPVSWWLKHHIDEGRQHLNFSVWGTYTAKKADHKLEECIEMVEEGEMPMTSYTLMHPEAKLTEAEKSKLITWFKSERIQ